MNELTRWTAKIVKAERGVVHLEDALLTGSFTRYFVHRLRFLVARTFVATLIHALKIVLLLGAFPREQFLVIVIAQSAAALIGDFWWGALEQLRAQIRLLQRRGRRYLVPREIGRWLSLVWPAALILPMVAGLYAATQLVSGELDPVGAYLCVLVAAVALDLLTRTYHSGAYALRRVYRPLPTLIAVDIVSVAVLLAVWPLLGLWAYPVAELVSLVVVVGITLRYTTRTYRSLGMPTLRPLLRQHRPMPSLSTLRHSLAPGVAYALVGLEAVVVIAGLAEGTSQAGANLVVLLAALSPVSRASFEWARLLYFDLKRLELPLLAAIRRKFDRAMSVLAVVIGFVAGGLACAVAVVMLDRPSTLLLAALVAFFGARSVLAAAQMQAFTRTVYLRLALSGLVGVTVLVVVFALTGEAELRLLGASAGLAISLALLAILPPPIDPGDVVLGSADWLSAFRAQTKPVHFARLRFDADLASPAVAPDTRRTEEWRRDEIARRIGERARRRGGAVAWAGAHELWLFSPPEGALTDQRVLVRHGAGLVRATRSTVYDDPPAAALGLAEVALRAWNDDWSRTPAQEARYETPALADVRDLVAEFERRFPNAISFDARAKVPTALRGMASEERVELLRAALRFASDQRAGRESEEWDVTALVDEGVLRAVFAVPRSHDPAARRVWRRRIRAWNLRRAGGAATSAGRARSGSVASEIGVSTERAAMM